MAVCDELFAYIKENLDTEPDYPFKEDIAIFRHKNNRKWFAAVIKGLPRKKLGLDEEGTCDIVDLKCDPMISGPYRKMPGVFSGYHMNKEHWLTVILDGRADTQTIWELVNISYEMTRTVVKNKRKSTDNNV